MGSSSPGLPALPHTQTHRHTRGGHDWARIPLYQLGLQVRKPTKHQIKRQKRKCCGRVHQQWQGGVLTNKKEKENTHYKQARKQQRHIHPSGTMCCGLTHLGAQGPGRARVPPERPGPRLPSSKQQCMPDLCLQIKTVLHSGFPGGPVVKTLRFHCRGCGFDPWWGN